MSSSVPDQKALTRSEAITEELRSMILAGKFGEDLRLPPERELAETFRVHRITLAKALHSLAEEGMIVRRVGSGTYINPQALEARSALTLINVLLPFPELPSSTGAAVTGGDTIRLLGGPGVAEMVYNFFRNRSVKIAISFFRMEQELAGLLDHCAAEENAAHIVWYCPGREPRKALLRLREAGRLFCLVDGREPDLECNYVGTDHRLGGRMAARLLLQAGHRRLLYVTASLDNGTLLERREGFTEEAAVAGAAVDTAEGEVSAAQLSKRLRKEKATAIGCSHDALALQLMRRLQEEGWRIPQDLSVVGYDGLAVARYHQPPLTTIRQAFDTIGAQAAGMIDRQWKARGCPPQVTLVPPSVQAGESVRAV